MPTITSSKFKITTTDHKSYTGYTACIAYISDLHKYNREYDDDGEDTIYVNIDSDAPFKDTTYYPLMDNSNLSHEEVVFFLDKMSTLFPDWRPLLRFMRSPKGKRFYTNSNGWITPPIGVTYYYGQRLDYINLSYRILRMLTETPYVIHNFYNLYTKYNIKSHYPKLVTADILYASFMIRVIMTNSVGVFKQTDPFYSEHHSALYEKSIPSANLASFLKRAVYERGLAIDLYNLDSRFSHLPRGNAQALYSRNCCVATRIDLVYAKNPTNRYIVQLIKEGILIGHPDRLTNRTRIRVALNTVDVKLVLSFLHNLRASRSRFYKYISGRIDTFK